jgi:hypothetical protein
MNLFEDEVQIVWESPLLSEFSSNGLWSQPLQVASEPVTSLSQVRRVFSTGQIRGASRLPRREFPPMLESVFIKLEDTRKKRKRGKF